MAKKNLFSRIANSLQGPKERTSDDLDQELEDAVNAINEEEVELLNASSVMSGGWGEAGDSVFIMSLPPIYEMIGGRQGRMAEGLREACKNIFSEKIGADRGRHSFKSDNFIMRFYEPKEVGFKLAGGTINAIGTYILSGRFKTLDVPDLLTVAEVGDITNADGSLDAGKIKATVESGGRPVEMNQPKEGAPEWYKLFWKDNVKLADMFENSQTKDSDDPQWSASIQDEQKSNQVWTSMGPEKIEKKERTERGPDRRQEKTGVNARKERRTSWRPRRMADEIK